jgi:hypothetical protein
MIVINGAKHAPIDYSSEYRFPPLFQFRDISATSPFFTIEASILPSPSPVIARLAATSFLGRQPHFNEPSILSLED